MSQERAAMVRVGGVSDHEMFLGQDDELEYLVRTYTDGAVTIATRPLGGIRWSPEVALTVQPAEVCS